MKSQRRRRMSNLQTQAANRYVVWNGEPRQYEMWRKKFVVNCRSRRVYGGFELDKDDYPKLPSKANITDKEKKEHFEKLEDFMDKNYKSFEHLVNSIDHNKDKGTQALNFVFGARTSIFPDGSAQKVLEKLDDQYNAKDIQDQEELQLLYDEAKLNQKNPHDFEQDMCELRRKLKVQYQIEKSDREYTQKLVNSINLKEYELDKRLIRRMQKD